MSQQKEIELKLELPPGNVGALDRLSFLKGIKPAKAKTLLSVYFDTSDQKLRRKGVSLRIRRVDGRHLQTIKQRGNPSIGLFSRDEWECDVEGRQPDLDAARGTVLEPLLSKKLRRNLKPIFETRVRRQIYPVRRGASEIELSIDRGKVEAAGASSPLCEMELELKKGEPGELFEIVRALGDAVPVKLAIEDKAGQGYDLMAEAAPRPVRAEPIALASDHSWSTSFQVIARACLHQIAANETALRDGDFGAVHQMRIGIRRLRAAISVFKETLAGPQTEAMKKQLKWLAGELGSVREIDVFIKRVTKEAKSENADRAGVGSMIRDLEQRRRRAMGRAKNAVASAHYRCLLIDAAAWIEAGDWLHDDNELRRTLREQPVRAAAATELRRRWKKVRKRGAKFAKLDARRRHRFRIDTKKLRYASEFFTGIFHSKKSIRWRENFISKLEAMQDALGDLNDIVVQDRLARDAIDPPAARRGELAAKKAFAAGRLSGRDTARFQSLEKDAKRTFGAVAKAPAFWE